MKAQLKNIRPDFRISHPEDLSRFRQILELPKDSREYFIKSNYHYAFFLCALSTFEVDKISVRKSHTMVVNVVDSGNIHMSYAFQDSLILKKISYNTDIGKHHDLHEVQLHVS